MNSISSGGRFLELEKELAAQKIEAEEAADELERKRHELQAAGHREEMLRQQLDTANTKIASLEEHVSLVFVTRSWLIQCTSLCVYSEFLLICCIHFSKNMVD